MIYVNIPDKEYKKVEKSKLIGGVQYYYVHFNADSSDGVTHAVEHEIDHYPTKEDFVTLQNNWEAFIKKCQIVNLEAYANSEDVRAFYVNGEKASWINSETRISISKATDDKEKAGRAETTLHLSTGSYTITIEQMKDFLSKLEVYASDCYDATEKHKANIKNASAKEAENYDYTTDFPDILSFTF